MTKKQDTLVAVIDQREFCFIVDPRINETLQTGAVRNRTYRGRKCLFIFRIHHKWIYSLSVRKVVLGVLLYTN